MNLSVVRPGAQSFVIDAGRFGLRHLGIAWCGAADRRAFDAANALLGNAHDRAALEITFGNAEFVFEERTAFALTGADAFATLDGEAIGGWLRHDAPRGARLRLSFPQRGVRTVLAIAGGFDVPLVMGSRTTDLAAAFGGFEGRALRAGDALPIGAPAHDLRPSAQRAPQRLSHARVVPFDAFASLSPESQQAFWTNAWTAGHESNRMGYRFEGARLEYAGAQTRSQGVFPGFVQIPPSGQPIVLLCDAQTTGGYPVVGMVHEDDLGEIAQLRPGETLGFVEMRPS